MALTIVVVAVLGGRWWMTRREEPGGAPLPPARPSFSLSCGTAANPCHPMTGLKVTIDPSGYTGRLDLRIRAFGRLERIGPTQIPVGLLGTTEQHVGLLTNPGTAVETQVLAAYFYKDDAERISTPAEHRLIYVLPGEAPSDLPNPEETAPASDPADENRDQADPWR